MLENVQIHATKLVDGIGNLDYEEKLKRLNLPSLAFRRFRGDLIELYKHFHHYDQDTIPPSFQRRERVTRKHEYQLLQRRAKDGIRDVRQTMADLKHGLIFCCILEGWLSLIRRSFTSDNNYSQCCIYPACISININNPFITNDHQIIWRNSNAISD